MKCINKLISITLIIMLLIFPLVFISVHAADSSQEGLSIEVFSSQLRDLVNRYWPGENKSESNINTLSTSSDYTLMNRLIIKTDSNEPLSEDCGAIEKIEGYGNLHIMQYEDEISSESAYDFYCEQTYVDYAEYDFIFTAADYDDGEEISVYPYVYNIPWYQKVINSDA